MFRQSKKIKKKLKKDEFLQDLKIQQHKLPTETYRISNKSGRENIKMVDCLCQEIKGLRSWLPINSLVTVWENSLVIRSNSLAITQ